MPDDPPSTPEARPRAWPMSRSELAGLVEAYADRLVRYAIRQVGNVPDAEDVVQDVFVKLITGGWHDRVALVGPYLFRAVANTCTDLLRRRARAASPGGEGGLGHLASDDAGPLEAAQAAEGAGRAEAILDRLPPEQAEAIRLRVFDGLRLDEIAEVLGCPINTVSSRLRYGFQKLRDAAGQKGAHHDLR